MNWIINVLIVFGAYVTIFLAVTFTSFRQTFGISFDLSPAIVVYLALTSDITTMTLFCVLAGIFGDAFSLNPLGLSVLSLFLTGCGIRAIREMILRERLLLRGMLGSIAFIAVPLIGFLWMFWIWPLFQPVVIAQSGEELLMELGYGASTYGWQPVPNWGWTWKAVVLALFGAVATPVIMWVSDWFKQMFTYPIVSESSFRRDREIKRGRNR